MCQYEHTLQKNIDFVLDVFRDISMNVELGKTGYISESLKIKEKIFKLRDYNRKIICTFSDSKSACTIYVQQDNSIGIKIGRLDSEIERKFVLNTISNFFRNLKNEQRALDLALKLALKYNYAFVSCIEFSENEILLENSISGKKIHIKFLDFQPRKSFREEGIHYLDHSNSSILSKKLKKMLNAA